MKLRVIRVEITACELRLLFKLPNQDQLGKETSARLALHVSFCALGHELVFLEMLSFDGLVTCSKFLH